MTRTRAQAILAVTKIVTPSAESRSQHHYQENILLTIIAVVEMATSHASAPNLAKAWPVITAARKGMEIRPNPSLC